MNWKAFITACISTAIVSFPQNIIGCGPGVDPYDYYTSFFHQNLPETDNYKPFYYTGYSFLYDSMNRSLNQILLADEWAAYCDAPVKSADAKNARKQICLERPEQSLFSSRKKSTFKNTRLGKDKTA